MTPPITNTPRVETKGYVQIEGGVNNYTNTLGTNLGAMLGGQISKGGTYANAEVGYGTAFKAKAEVGHEFSIGKNMGLELSGNAEYVKSSVKDSFTAYTQFDTTTSSTVIANETSSIDNDVKIFSKSSWKDGYKKAGGALMMSFRGKKGNIKAGVEIGAYNNDAPNISVTHAKTVESDNGYKTTSVLYEYKGHNSGMYVTPKVSAELNLGKKNNWSVVANADKFGGNAGVRYTF